MKEAATNPNPPSELRLTQTVQKGGCAAKVSASELRKILAGVRFPEASRSLLPESLLIDGRFFDDASVHRLTSEIAIVSTLDFFTPIVDSPRTFGAIAAANALSDVYAMGGRPLTALGILAFPVATFENDVIQAVMQGACDVLSEARATLSGGHSIDDDTLKFGLAVTGLVHPEKIWSNTGARAGDVLILTKALGTGALTAALKRQVVSENEIQPALDSMMQLNNVIDLLETAGLASAVHAATDITGFGLAGHSMQVANASAVDLEFEFNKLPLLPGALEMIRDGFLTKAHRTNREYTEKAILICRDIATEKVPILFDPQTSGGLLLSVEASEAALILAAIAARFPFACAIGRVAVKKNSGVMVSFE
jgi:selenide,water dikinase